MATVLLEVALDMAKQRNVADTSDDEHEHRQGEDKDSESRRHHEGRGDEVAIEVLLDIVPVPIVLLREVKRIQGQRVDRLTRTVSEEQPLPACSTGELHDTGSSFDDTHS